MTSTITPQRSISETANHAAEAVANGTDQAIRTTQRVTNQALDRLADVVHQAPAAIHDTTAQAEALARRGADAMRERSEQWRSQAGVVSKQAREAIQQEPLKAVAMAAAVGVGLAALWVLLSRRPDARR